MHTETRFLDLTITQSSVQQQCDHVGELVTGAQNGNRNESHMIVWSMQNVLHSTVEKERRWKRKEHERGARRNKTSLHPSQKSIAPLKRKACTKGGNVNTAHIEIRHCCIHHLCIGEIRAVASGR